MPNWVGIRNVVCEVEYLMSLLNVSTDRNRQRGGKESSPPGSGTGYRQDEEKSTWTVVSWQSREIQSV